jgi:hypothetical protein
METREDLQVNQDDRPTRLRREFEDALMRDRVRDPFSIAASIAISAAVSAASYAVSAAFAPKPKPVVRGQATGELIVSSEQGAMIAEIYGGDPGDGKGGGVPCSAIVMWTSGVRRFSQ